MRRDYDTRTGRPLIGGQDHIEALTERELEAEPTIAAAEPHHRAHRLQALLLEQAKRRRAGRRQPAIWSTAHGSETPDQPRTDKHHRRRTNSFHHCCLAQRPSIS